MAEVSVAPSPQKDMTDLSRQAHDAPHGSRHHRVPPGRVTKKRRALTAAGPGTADAHWAVGGGPARRQALRPAWPGVAAAAGPARGPRLVSGLGARTPKVHGRSSSLPAPAAAIAGLPAPDAAPPPLECVGYRSSAPHRASKPRPTHGGAARGIQTCGAGVDKAPDGWCGCAAKERSRHHGSLMPNLKVETRSLQDFLQVLDILATEPACADSDRAGTPRRPQKRSASAARAAAVDMPGSYPGNRKSARRLCNRSVEHTRSVCSLTRPAQRHHR